MAFTIYTVSDPATIGTALTSMAMFFGQDDWIGSAIKTGLIFSLLFIVGKGVTQNGLRLDHMLLQLIVIWAMFLPKTTVTIEQFDNAAPPRVVDDVPLAIAVPSSLAGSFALYMTNKIEAVMVNVDGDYIKTSGDEHPFNPARMLMSITACANDPLSCVDQNTVESMRLASRFCAGPDLANTEFKSVKSVFEEFAKTLTAEAQTIIYDKDDAFIPGGAGSGRVVSCASAADFFREIAAQTKDGTSPVIGTISSLLNKSQVQRYGSIARANDGTEKSVDEMVASINRTRDVNSKIDTIALANVATFAIADSLKYSASSPIDEAINVRRDTALFDWAKNDAGNAMLVSATAPKFMDVLFFIFIASTPIVMFMVAANPEGGLKIAGSYVLFGMWTQSWVPMMAIVMSWYQQELRNLASPPGGAQVTAESMGFYMRHVYTTTIASANMLQQAPYIMSALMAGSMLGLAGIVSKATSTGKGLSSTAVGGSSAGSGSGAGGGDPLMPGPKGAIPGAGLRSALAGGGAALAYGSAASSATMVGDADSANPGLATLSGATVQQSQASAANEKSAATRAQVTQQQTRAMEAMTSMIQQAGASLGGQRVAEMMRAANFNATFDATNNRINTDVGSIELNGSRTNSNTGAFTAGGAANWAVGGGTGKLFAAATGLSANLQAAYAEKHQEQGSTGVTAKDAKTTQLSGGTGSGVSTTNGAGARSGVSGSSGSNWSKLASDAESVKNSVSEVAAATKAFDEADKKTQQATTSASANVGMELKGGAVATNYGAQAVMNGTATANDGRAVSNLSNVVAPALSGSQAAQFQARTAELMKENQRLGRNDGLGRDQAAAAAGWQALSEMANSPNASSADRIGAQLGMAYMGKAAGMGDMTAPLLATKQGMEQMAGIDAKLKAMENTVKPATDAAVAAASSDLSPEALKARQDGHRDYLKQQKQTAGSLNGSANAGLSKVQAEGAEALQKKQAEINRARTGVPVNFVNQQQAAAALGNYQAPNAIEDNRGSPTPVGSAAGAMGTKLMEYANTISAPVNNAKAKAKEVAEMRESGSPVDGPLNRAKGAASGSVPSSAGPGQAPGSPVDGALNRAKGAASGPVPSSGGSGQATGSPVDGAMDRTKSAASGVGTGTPQNTAAPASAAPVAQPSNGSTTSTTTTQTVVQTQGGGGGGGAQSNALPTLGTQGGASPFSGPNGGGGAPSPTPVPNGPSSKPSTKNSQSTASNQSKPKTPGR